MQLNSIDWLITNSSDGCWILLSTDPATHPATCLLTQYQQSQQAHSRLPVLYQWSMTSVRKTQDWTLEDPGTKWHWSTAAGGGERTWEENYWRLKGGMKSSRDRLTVDISTVMQCVARSDRYASIVEALLIDYLQGSK